MGLTVVARFYDRTQLGRLARLEASRREGPESGRKPSFDCEPEIGFTALGGHRARSQSEATRGCP